METLLKMEFKELLEKPMLSKNKNSNTFYHDGTAKKFNNVLFDNYDLWLVHDAKHDMSKRYTFFTYILSLKYVS